MDTRPMMYRWFGIILVCVALLRSIPGFDSGPDDVIDPCNPPFPCQPGTRMANPEDCSAYYVCVVVAGDNGNNRWTPVSCVPPTISYDFNETSCVDPNVYNVSCHGRCPANQVTLQSVTQSLEGQPFQVNCSLWGYSAVVVGFTWLLNGQVITGTIGGGGTRITITSENGPGNNGVTNSTLAFNPVLYSDSGTFQCVVEYNTKYAIYSSVLSIQVTPLPSILLSAQVLTVYVGGRILLICSLQIKPGSDNLGLSFQWFRDGQYLNDGFYNIADGMSSQLNISASNAYNNSTVVQCRAQNSVGISANQTCNVNIIQRNVPVCGGVSDPNYAIVWSLTRAGATDVQTCPGNATGVCTRICATNSDGSAASWSATNCNNCVDQKLSTVLNQISGLEEGVGLANSSLVASVANSLSAATVTNATTGLNPGSINATVDALTRLSTLRRDYQNISSADQSEINFIVSSISNLLQPSNKDSWNILQTNDATVSATLLSSADIYGNSLANLVNGSRDRLITISSDNMLLEASSIFVDQIPGNGVINFPSINDNSSSTSGSWTSYTNDRIAINIGGSGNQLPLGLWSSYYRNIDDYLPGKSDTTFINSRVLSLSTNATQTNFLSHPIEITLQHSQIEGINWTGKCVFWNFSTSGRGGGWSDNGCTVLSTNSTHTICLCDHLTNFAILMSLSPSDDVILSIISTVGCSITVASLCLTIIAYIITWKRVKSDQSAVLMNLCVALIIANVVFLAGADKTNPTEACKTVAVLLHYFFLAAFFIMLAEGVELLLYIFFVFHIRRTRETVAIILTAWLLPLVIVAISLGVTRTQGYGNSQACWLSVKSGLIWAFIGPVLCIMLTNLIILAVVLRRVSVARFPANKNEKKNRARATFWNIAVISPILGIAWVFGILSVSFNLVAFQYIFAIANSLQGLLIFIFHVLCNNKMGISSCLLNTVCCGRRLFSVSASETRSRITGPNAAARRNDQTATTFVRKVPNERDGIVPRLVDYYQGLNDDDGRRADGHHPTDDVYISSVSSEIEHSELHNNYSSTVSADVDSNTTTLSSPVLRRASDRPRPTNNVLVLGRDVEFTTL